MSSTCTKTPPPLGFYKAFVHVQNYSFHHTDNLFIPAYGNKAFESFKHFCWIPVTKLAFSLKELKKKKNRGHIGAMLLS